MKGGLMVQDTLYYRHPLVTEARTTITGAWQVEGHVHLTLAETIFYPEGGGQPADRGWIDDQPVLHVFTEEMEDGQENVRVINVLGSHPGSEEVRCRLDIDTRRHHMQHHSAQHLLSAIALADNEWRTVGFHLGEEYATIDFSCEEWTEAQLRSLEQAANERIWQNLPVQTHVLDRKQRTDLLQANLRVRGHLPDEDHLRLVEIPGLDCSPCCGTHVAFLGQIGLVKIVRTERIRQTLRLFFVCGALALEDYQSKHSLVQSLTHSLTTGSADILNRVQEDQKKLNELQGENRRLQREWMILQARNWVQESRLVARTVEEEGLGDTWANAVIEAGAVAAIIQAGNKVFIKHNGEYPLDCGASVRASAEQYGGRGGGGSISAQCYFSDPIEGAKWAEMIRQNWDVAVERS